MLITCKLKVYKSNYSTVRDKKNLSAYLYLNFKSTS